MTLFRCSSLLLVRRPADAEVVGTSIDRFSLLPSSVTAKMIRQDRKSRPTIEVSLEKARLGAPGLSKGKRTETWLKAAADGDLPRMRALVKAGVDVNSVFPGGEL